MKGGKYHLNIEIDILTNSIWNTISQDSFPTEVFPVTAKDLKGITKKAGWKFNWRSEAKKDDRTVYTLKNNNMGYIYRQDLPVAGGAEGTHNSQEGKTLI